MYIFHSVSGCRARASDFVHNLTKKPRSTHCSTKLIVSMRRTDRGTRFDQLHSNIWLQCGAFGRQGSGVHLSTNGYGQSSCFRHHCHHLRFGPPKRRIGIYCSRFSSKLTGISPQTCLSRQGMVHIIFPTCTYTQQA